MADEGPTTITPSWASFFEDLRAREKRLKSAKPKPRKGVLELKTTDETKGGDEPT